MYKLSDLLNEFAKEVNSGSLKKIPYHDWRLLKKHENEYVRVERDGWGGLNLYYIDNNEIVTDVYEHDDSSFGTFLDDVYVRGLIKDNTCSCNTPTLGLNSSAFSNAINKVSEAAVKAGATITAAAHASNWTVSSSNDLATTSVSSNFYEKSPTVEITEKGLKLNGRSLNEVIDEATCNSINRKENNSMNLFKNVDFGSCENDNVKMSIYGIAVKNATGTWVSYDSKSGNVVDVDILNFSAKYLYKMPVAIKDIAVGDTVIHCRKPMFVTKIEDGKLLVIDPAAAEEKIVLPVKSPFGFDVYTKIVNLFGNLAAGASADSPFGNMLPLMLLADGDKTDDMLPLVFAMSGGKFDMSNPMMLYFLMSNNKANDNMLPLLFAMNNNCFSIPAPSAE